MTTSYSLSKPLTSTPVPWWWNDAIAASRSFMLKPAFPSLACVPSDATISSTSSIGHSGKNDGRRSAPLDALQLPSNRPCASSQKRRSFGPASEAGGEKSAKSSLGGLWYWIVCLPLFRFLLFRWIWRIALWCRFLWRLAKLDLHLVPTHPDGAAGLGYLEVVQTHFTALVLAISILVSATFAEEISSGKTVFEVIYPALVITLILDLALILLPPCVFAFKLRACQEKGLSDYTVFAARYVNDFEK